jgi:hypothetical protein
VAIVPRRNPMNLSSVAAKYWHRPSVQCHGCASCWSTWPIESIPDRPPWNQWHGSVTCGCCSYSWRSALLSLRVGGLSQARFPTSCYRNPYAVSLSRPRIAEALLEDNAIQSIIGLRSTGIKTDERLGAAYDVN